MGAQHTPGPWQAYASVQKGRGYLIDTAMLTDSSNGTVIADSVCGHHAEANARLIAAAPELLEALERLTAFADGPAETPSGPMNVSDLARGSAMKFGILLIQELPAIRAAIAKATGGQHD